MPKQRSLVEQTTFAQGLITEANPLTFPANASIDEDNFIIQKQGTRRRRLGIDYETNSVTINTSTLPSAFSGQSVFSSYAWKSAGGNPNITVSVIHIGDKIFFLDNSTSPISGNLIYTHDLGGIYSFISFASVDGLLVVAKGERGLLVFSYESGVITEETIYLKMRDLFGVSDLDGGTDLTQGIGLLKRPTTLTQNHRYNLRNQSFNVPRLPKTGDILGDTITSFYAVNGSYPSNSDAIGYSFYPNVDETNKTVERYIAEDAIGNTIGSFQASKGHFIIDVINRGASRLSEYAKLLSTEPLLDYPLTSLPVDSGGNGANVVGEYAGRVWFGGFNSENTLGKDSTTPYLMSYVFFSQLVKGISDISRCYQEADPTSREQSDLVDTDGGFLRISGAYGIVGFKTLKDSLLIFAANGVWRVFGGDTGFTATSYIVSKITDHGCTSPNSIVEADAGVAYWGDDGIYLVTLNEFGDYVSTSISQNTIQSLYEDVSSLDKLYCFGAYDSYERKIRWIYRNNLLTTQPVKELVLDLNLNAFYPSTFNSITGDRPKPVCFIETPPFSLASLEVGVVANEVDVVAGTDPVIITEQTLEDGLRELMYVVLVENHATGYLQFTLAYAKDLEFLDWKSFDSVGVDAAGYLLTGYLVGGDTQRKKTVPYLTTHFLRTEDGFTDDGFGDLTPTSPSSCLIQAQWEWTNSANSKRWGREFQAYRYNRLYFPTNISDPYDTGHHLITTKNKIRGHGRALSLLMKTEPGKDCRILGWSMITGVDGNV